MHSAKRGIQVENGEKKKEKKRGKYMYSAKRREKEGKKEGSVCIQVEKGEKRKKKKSRAYIFSEKRGKGRKKE